MNQPVQVCAADYANFGEALQAYRLSVGERLRGLNPHLPRMEVSAAALIEAMGSAGYAISPGAYSEIEAGHSLPRDARAFLDALCPALAIERNSLDWWILHQYLARDLVARKLGPEAAAMVVVNVNQLAHRLETERHVGEQAR